MLDPRPLIECRHVGFTDLVGGKTSGGDFSDSESSSDSDDGGDIGSGGSEARAHQRVQELLDAAEQSKSAGERKRKSAEAVKILTRFAEAGDKAAQNTLGVVYHDGLACQAKDEVKAIKWLREACQKGVTGNESNLADLLKESGDHAEALEWMIKAADRGNTNALYMLGRWYAEGDGIPEDRSKAKDVSYRRPKRCFRVTMYKILCTI